MDDNIDDKERNKRLNRERVYKCRQKQKLELSNKVEDVLKLCVQRLSEAIWQQVNDQKQQVPAQKPAIIKHPNKFVPCQDTILRHDYSPSKQKRIDELLRMCQK